MGLVDRFRSWLVRPLAVESSDPPGMWKDLGESSTYGTIAGIGVNPEKGKTLSAYMACMRVVAEDSGKLPLFVYGRLEPRGKQKLPKHPYYRLLHNAPNPMITSQVFRETITHWAAGWGNGYAEIEREPSGLAVAMWPIHPSRCTPKYDKSGDLQYEVLTDTYTKTYLQPQDVLHIRGLGDEIAGYSVCKYAAQSIGVAIAAQQFAAAYFGNGLAFGGILEHPNKLTPESRKNLRESFKERHGGSAKAHQMAILEEGMKYSKIGIPPEEAQFLESRQFQVEEICRWFRVAPHKIQHLLRSTYSNIEQQSIEHVTDTLMPWLVRWEQEIAKKLFADSPEVFAEHLVSGLLRGDAQARAQYYRERFNVGSLSINDIRELENENPIGPDGDEYFLQLGMAPVSRIVAQPIEPAKSQVDEPEESDDDMDEDEMDGDMEEREAAKAIGDDQARMLCASVVTDHIMRSLRKDAIQIERHAKRDGFVEWCTEYCNKQKKDLRDNLVDSLWGVFLLMRPDVVRCGSVPSGVMIDAFYDWLCRRYIDTREGLANDATCSDFVAKIFEGLQNCKKWGVKDV